MHTAGSGFVRTPTPPRLPPRWGSAMPLPTLRFGLIALALGTLTGADRLAAAPPSDADERKALAGSPTALRVEPPAVALAGPRDVRQLLVTGVYPDGRTRDLTHAVTLTGRPSAVQVSDGLFLRARL